MTSEADGGFAPFSHGELEATFHFWSQSGAPPLLDGMAWAFVDWVLPNISGLEVCRRLRQLPLILQVQVYDDVTVKTVTRKAKQYCCVAKRPDNRSQIVGHAE